MQSGVSRGPRGGGKAVRNFEVTCDSLETETGFCESRLGSTERRSGKKQSKYISHDNLICQPLFQNWVNKLLTGIKKVP